MNNEITSNHHIDTLSVNIETSGLHNDRQPRSIYASYMEEINSISEIIDSYPFETQQAYGYFLNQQYFLIRYSTRLLALAASLIDTQNHQEFVWWSKHLQEELGHDLTILHDMEAIGFSYQDHCEPMIRCLGLALFEDIRKHGQDALLGYALMLEGLSMERCGILTDRISNAYGKGYSYFKLHAVADEKHFPQGIQRIERFSPERQSVILQNLKMSSYMYRNFLCALNSRNWDK